MPSPENLSPEDMPEHLIVLLARNGDEDAFADLVRRRQSWLRNLMRRACGEAALADDLVQQAFLTAWRKLPQLREPAHFGAWLKKLAINLWLQEMRAKDALREAGDIDETLPAPPADPAAAMDLDRALGLLPAAQRLCVVLSYHEGMTHREIAETTGLPDGTVKSHIRRGTARLRDLLSAYREIPPTENDA